MAFAFSTPPFLLVRFPFYRCLHHITTEAVLSTQLLIFYWHSHSSKWTCSKLHAKAQSGYDNLVLDSQKNFATLKLLTLADTKLKYYVMDVNT